MHWPVGGLSITLGHRDPPTHAECLTGDLDARGGLTPLVFVHINKLNNVPNCIGIVTGCDDSLGVTTLYDIRLEDAVEYFIRR